MCRKVVATLLIAGWVILSGFDVFVEFPGQTAVSKLFHNRASTVVRREPLVNDIESAYHIQQPYFYLVGFTVSTLDLDAAAYFHLHKLYRVFLI
jgi:hypothetical protein